MAQTAPSADMARSIAERPISCPWRALPGLRERAVRMRVV